MTPSAWKPVNEAPSAWKPVAESGAPAQHGDRLKGTPTGMPDNFMGTIAKDFAAIPEGAYNTVAHPIETLKGAWRQLVNLPSNVVTDISQENWGKLGAKLSELAIPALSTERGAAMAGAAGTAVKEAASATAGKVAEVAANPVARELIGVVSPRAKNALAAVHRVKTAAEAAAAEEVPAVAEAATPGQALAKASGQDWAKMSGEDRAMLESVAKAQANAAAQPPRPPMGPPVAVTEAPAPAGPRMTAADELRAEMEAQRAAAPPIPEAPQPALGGHDTTPALSRGTPVRPPLRRPLPTETRAQYEAAINAPVSTASVEATPVTQPPPAPGPVEVPMSTAQAEAAIAKKAPAPVEEPQSQYTASGERKSPQLRAAEITGKNVTAKAQRWAEALQAEGITAEDVGNMTPADLEVMNNGLQAKGRLPQGEKAPGQSLPEIVARLRKLGGESKQASAAISPESEVGTRLTPKQRAIAEQMKAAMEEQQGSKH